jgi:hypothetical protein
MGDQNKLTTLGKLPMTQNELQVLIYLYVKHDNVTIFLKKRSKLRILKEYPNLNALELQYLHTHNT